MKTLRQAKQKQYQVLCQCHHTNQDNVQRTLEEQQRLAEVRAKQKAIRARLWREMMV